MIPTTLSFVRSHKKLFFAAIVLIAVAIGAFVLFFPSQSKTQYQTAAVERGTIIASVSATGTVTTTHSADVTTQASGVVKTIFVQNGDVVKAGDKIAELDPDIASQQKTAQAYASYMSALSGTQSDQQNKIALQADLEAKRKAVLDAQNAYDFMNNNLINPATKNSYTDLEKQSIESTLTNAHTAFTAAEKKFLQADTVISAGGVSQSAAWLSYQQTQPIIIAPISGTVADISLVQGAVIANNSSSTTSSTSSSGSSQKVATIKTAGTPTVTVNLSEIDIPKIKIGNKATITFDALPGKTFTGRVYAIDTTGAVSSGVTTYPVALGLDTAIDAIYPNMSASANIITATKDNVLIVPLSAVQTSGTQSTVRLYKNNTPQTTAVETGISSDTQIEITSGVSEGDMVVTSVISTASRGATTSPFSSGIRTGGFGGGGIGGAARGR